MYNLLPSNHRYTASTTSYQGSHYRGEFTEFTNLLPKTMFSSGVEPEARRSLTVQLASTGNDLSIHPTPGSRKITSFSSWMEAMRRRK